MRITPESIILDINQAESESYINECIVACLIAVMVYLIRREKLR